MARLQALLECIGQALCDKGRKALQGHWPFADVFSDIAKEAFDSTHRKLPGPDFRLALAECATVESATYERMVEKLIKELGEVSPVPKVQLTDYLRALPPCVRQALRRPSDPDGHTVPDKFSIYKSEEFAAFLPPRLPRFRPGDKPAGLDGWTLTELRGFGPCSEVWRAEDPAQQSHSPAALKFITDPEAAEKVRASAELFTKAFELNGMPGVLPLRSVYLESDPPCLEFPYVYGYDLSGLLFEWHWRYDTAKPEAALKLIRRLATITSQGHGKGIVHRDLKPTNVLFHPTEGGKFTLWVGDYGWSQIASCRALEVARMGPRGEQQRLAYRGTATALYASPQQSKKDSSAPADDIHALGMLWFQMLKRDQTATAPIDTEWAEELRSAGVTDSQARLLHACLAMRPDRRPTDATELAAQLANVTVAPPEQGVPDGSKLITLRNPESAVYPSRPATQPRGKVFDADAAASSAAALLSASGVAPKSGAPGSSPSAGVRLVKNSIGMTFIRLPAGVFRMGSAAGELGHRQHESPVHEVHISKAFYISVIPVTQAQYEAVKHKNPSHFNSKHGGGPEHPIENVTWGQAVRFCEQLERMPSEVTHHHTYRLPTEAEWEYACRAGTATAFNCGERLTGADALFAEAGGKFARKSTCPVAQFAGNAWGLLDMHGNVQEWVQDWFEEFYYHDSPGVDPIGPTRGLLRTIRGGSWASHAADCRSAARVGHDPHAPSDSIGFRVVLSVS